MAGRARRDLLRDRRRAQPVVPERDPAEATATESTVSPYFTVSQLRDRPRAEMLFGEIVPQGAIGYILGRGASYKTFLALDLALCLITGLDWNDRPLLFGESGRALFVAGEGVSSFIKRIDAWVHHHGIEHDAMVQNGINPKTGLATWETTGERAPGMAPWQEDSLVVRDGAVDLYAGADAFRELLSFVKEQQFGLILIDTLARSAGAAEQNSASDMSVITARIAALKAASGPDATVIVVAHTTKADTEDARGASSIIDDADFALHCKKDSNGLRVRIAKMKDGESGQDINLKVLSVGESLVLVPGEPEPASQWASDDIAQRIRGVLYSVRDLDPPTATQILALVKDDGTGKSAGKAMVYRTLGELQSSGQISVSGTTGKGVTTVKHWKLNKSAYPPDER